MLVSIELLNLTQQKGYLSPELAVGYQIGKYVEEFFDGLGEVEIAASLNDDAVLALSYLRRRHGHPGQIIVPECSRPWDFLFYHFTTGTLQSFTLIRKHTQLSNEIRNLESELFVDNKTAVKTYRTGLNLLIKSILNQPVTSFCQIRQVRCRRLQPRRNGNQQTICYRCGRLTPIHKAWDIEGKICCPSCSGLEPTWYTCH